MDLLMQMLLMERPRIEVIRETLLREWPLDAETRNSFPLKVVFNKWAAYLTMEKESVRHYEELKKAILLHFGIRAVEWLIGYTTFLTRDAYLRKKYKGADRVVTSTITLINFGL
jgi:hypothetical protein